MRYLLVFAIACGSSKAPPPTPVGPAAPMIAQPRNDVQVATVNGRPVWGSCVTAQAARGATRDEALQQCIDFELLAQAAEIRDLATDPDVLLETRTALVSQLVALEYEDRYNTPEEFGAYWTRSIERNKWRFDHPEARGSAYVRISLPKTASPEEDARAKQLIDEIYAALADERGLMRPHMDEIANRVVAGRAKVSSDVVAPDLRDGRLERNYTEALFSIPEVGSVAKPVRTPWGWDIVMFNERVAPVKMTTEEIIETALPEVKRSFFAQWVNKIITGLGSRVEVIEQNVQLLEQL